MVGQTNNDKYRLTAQSILNIIITGTIPCFALGEQIPSLCYFLIWFFSLLILAPAGEGALTLRGPNLTSFLTLRGKPNPNLTLPKIRKKLKSKIRGGGCLWLFEIHEQYTGFRFVIKYIHSKII